MADGAPVRLVAPVPADEDAAVTMAQGRSRPAWAEIDLAAVAHNAAVLARLAGPAELCAVVKAHGYGHGGPAVARAALAGGASRLAVALVDEGVELREHGVTAPVLLLSECDPAAAATALSYGLTPTLYSPDGIAAFSAAARLGGPARRRPRQGRHRDAPGRRGARGPAAPWRPPCWPSRCCVWRASGPTCPWPTASGREDRAYTEGQLDLFDRLVGRPGGRRHPGAAAARRQHGGRHRLPPLAPTTWCAAGSASTATCPGRRRARTPSTTQAGGARLRPAMALKARVVAVRTLDAGERPSYGRLRPLPARSLVATVPIGYADGVPRSPLRRGATRSSSAASAGPWPAW